MKLVSEMLLRALRARTHHEIQFFRPVVEFMNADKKKLRLRHVFAVEGIIGMS